MLDCKTRCSSSDHRWSQTEETLEGDSRGSMESIRLEMNRPTRANNYWLVSLLSVQVQKHQQNIVATARSNWS